MKNSIINTILLCIIFVLLVSIIIIKNRVKIIRFFKKKQVLRFIITVFIPFAVPFALSVLFAVADGWFDSTQESSAGVAVIVTTIIMIVIASLNLVIQFFVWCNEKKENDIRWENFAAKQAFNNLYEIFMGKMIQLRSSYHNGLKQGMLTDADIPYNIFDMLRKITWEFCNTVSKITDIPTKDMDGAFVYRYTYPGVSKKEKAWKWVTGKGAKFKPGLNDFAEIADSTFHYMSHNNVSIVFFNDKGDAIKAQQYVCSYRDYSHDCKGSIFAAKVAFSGNDQTLCEGIVMVNSYGHEFMDKLTGQTEKEFKELLQDSIFPCYSKLLSAELAMLYFRHQTDKDKATVKCKKQKKVKQKPITLPKTLKYHQKAFKCLIATTKKIWTKD